MLISVGTKSELKVRAVRSALDTFASRAAFEALKGYELRAGETESGVSAQPVSVEEMYRGAERRTALALKREPDAELGIGIESGLMRMIGRWFDAPLVVVQHRYLPQVGWALGTCLPIPDWTTNVVFGEKSELGHVVRRHAGGGEKDPHKYLSLDAIRREEVITQATLAALCPVLRPSLYYP